MAIVQRIAALQKRHQWLEQMLVQEIRQLHPDELRVTQIKKSKLRVKDEMAGLEAIRRRFEYMPEVETEFRQRTAVH